MNEKVTGANAPQPQPLSVAPLRPPAPAVTDRFGHALLSSREGSSEDARSSSASSRNEREGGSDGAERTDAHRNIDPMDEQLRRSRFLGDRYVLTGGAWMQAAQVDAANSAPTARAETKAELAGLIERMCSAMYVGDGSVISQRIVLGLDHVLPGALAEIVREGVHLTVRLNAPSEHAHRLMSAQREGLQRALEGDGSLRVEVLVQPIHGAMEEPHG